MTTRLDKGKLCAEIDNAQDWKIIVREIYRADTAHEKAKKRVKMLAKELKEKYNDNNIVISAEISDLKNYMQDCADIQAKGFERLSAIGKELTENDHNLATALDCHYSGYYARSFKGADKLDVSETVNILRGILQPVCDRHNNVDNNGASAKWDENTKGYLQLLSKSEYKRIQNSLSHFAKVIYNEDKMRFKGDSISYFLWGAIRRNKEKGIALPKSDDVIRNAMIDTVNRIYIQKNKKK